MTLLLHPVRLYFVSITWYAVFTVIGAQILVNHVDRRTAVAHEILSAESNYCRTLDIIYEVFYAPCQSALESNRAIISMHNVHIIFSDILQLRDASQ